MSVSSILKTIEDDVNTFNPVAFVQAVHTEFEVVKGRLENVEEVLGAAEPAINSLLAFLPAGSAIPAEVTTLLTLLTQAKTEKPAAK